MYYTFAPSKIEFRVTILPPSHIIMNTKQNVSLISSSFFESDIKLVIEEENKFEIIKFIFY